MPAPNPIDSVSLIKIFQPATKSEFFVETLWSIATFRVSEEKFQISFWQRFFFLWLRFFLFGRSKKKEMNKTALYTTGYFASLNMTPPSPRWRTLSLHASHPQRFFAFAQSDGENALHPPCQILLKPVILPDFL